MRFLVALCCLSVAVGQATCAAYCGHVTMACTGALEIFTTGGTNNATAACLAECMNFPQTAAADLDNTAATATANSLGCREYHASVAAADPTANAATHCPHASPASTVCKATGAVPACDDYCNALIKTCPTQSILAAAGWASCVAACATYMDQATLTTAYPPASTLTGDLGCRRYHVWAAAALDARDVHCPHADLLGGGVCGNVVTSFCQAVSPFCDATVTGFADAATCEKIFRNVPMGTAADTMGDTQYCRAYHLSVAFQGGATKDTHCPHTGQQGNGACGDACDAYCSQYAANCTGVTGAAAYSTPAACRTACMAFNNSMTITGNTLGCRLYHVGVAQTSQANSMTHCPHASQSGGGVCGGMAPSPTVAPGSPAATAAVSAFAVAVTAVAAFFL